MAADITIGFTVDSRAARASCIEVIQRLIEAATKMGLSQERIDGMRLALDAIAHDAMGGAK